MEEDGPSVHTPKALGQMRSSCCHHSVRGLGSLVGDSRPRCVSLETLSTDRIARVCNWRQPCGEAASAPAQSLRAVILLLQGAWKLKARHSEGR